MKNLYTDIIYSQDLNLYFLANSTGSIDIYDKKFNLLNKFHTPVSSSISQMIYSNFTIIVLYSNSSVKRLHILNSNEIIENTIHETKLKNSFDTNNKLMIYDLLNIQLLGFKSEEKDYLIYDMNNKEIIKKLYKVNIDIYFNRIKI